ncbi:MAG: hypothetical protein II007_02900 [Gammaproteobacteria bacterium]|nr:hypothetical protein [Gammaproteobacteria bacterium]
MGLIRNLWRGYRGGPNFACAQWQSFVIGEQLLQLHLPNTPFYTRQELRPERYPIDEQGWFEAHKKQLLHHHYVHLITKIWPFGYAIPIPFPGADQEVGQLSFQAQLKQVPEQAKMDAFDLERLGQLECLSREAHYWGEPPPEDAESQRGWQGANTRLKRECLDDFHHYQSFYPSLEAYIDECIAVYGYPPIHPEVREVAGRQFVFYIEGRGRQQYDRTYCLPLTSRYYLLLSFRHDVMGCSQRIQQAALAAEQRILSEMSLGQMVAERPPSHGELGEQRSRIVDAQEVTLVDGR